MFRVNQLLLLCLFLVLLSALKTPAHEDAIENTEFSFKNYVDVHLPAQTYKNVSLSYLYFVRVSADTQTHIGSKFKRINADRTNFTIDMSNCELNYFTAFGCIFTFHQKNFIQNQIHYNNVRFTESSRHIDGFYANLIARRVRWQNNYFENVTFINVDFARNNFKGVTFKDVVFIDCNFKNVNFRNAKFQNVQMNLSNYKRVSFRDATIEDSNFANANLMKVRFKGTTFKTSYINGEEYNGV